MGIVQSKKTVTSNSANKKQKDMINKINDNLGLNMGKSYNTTKKNYYSRLLTGRFLGKVENIQNGDVFYTGQEIYKQEDMLMPIAGKEYKHDMWTTGFVELESVAAAIAMQERIEITYPMFDRSVVTENDNIQNINQYFYDNIINKYLIKNNIIDDDFYQVMRGVLGNFHILYVEEKGYIGLEMRDKTQIKAKIEYEDLLLKEIQQGYTNDTIGDTRDQYKNGYTHILRNNLKMELQTWQVDLLFNWNKWNFVIGCRQIGKTYTSAFIAYREFWRSDKGYAGRDRLTLYLSATTEKMYAPKRYFEQMIAKDVEAGLIRSVGSRGLYVNKITGAELKFISAEAKGGADSFFADACIIDEGAMISNEYFMNLLPILEQQNTNVFAIGTIDENSVKNWFYENAVIGELGQDDTISTMRVTIDDNELATEESKEKLKRKYKPFPMLYWCKLYATFPSTGKVFNLAGAIRQIMEGNRQETAIIGYDPAKTSDNPGLVVFDPTTFEVTQEHSLKGLSYMEQYVYIKELKKMFGKAIVIMDRRGVGEAVYEIMESIIDFGVYYTTTKKAKFDPEAGWWSVQKKHLVEALQLYLTMYGLKVGMQLTNLIKEMKGFKKIIVGKSVLYEGVGVTDDSVNALLLIVFYMNVIAKTTKPVRMKDSTANIDYNYTGGFNLQVQHNVGNHTESRMKKFTY